MAGSGTDDDSRVPPWWTDPTENVKISLESERRRQDDLRHAMENRVRSEATLRAEHAKEMREAESARINAILAAQQAAVQRAAEVQLAQQQALAAQVAAAAETNRQLAATTAATVAETLRTTVAPMLTRLDELSRAQYETQGQKQQVVETREVRSGSNSGNQVWIGIAGLALVIIIYLLTKKNGG